MEGLAVRNSFVAEKRKWKVSEAREDHGRDGVIQFFAVWHDQRDHELSDRPWNRLTHSPCAGGIRAAPFEPIAPTW